MTTEQAKELIAKDRDFIYAKRYEYSLAKLLERYPDGVPDRLIAAVLLMTEDDVQEIYDRIVVKLRARMGVSL